jgi:outer membrane protein TolC
VELALSGGCLLRTRNSADWQDGAQVNVPITSALRLSAAMRRSERPELPGQDQMREVVSLAYALDGAPR